MAGTSPVRLSFDERTEFAGRHASRQRRERIVLRGRADRMQRTETKRNQHPAQRAIDHHCLERVGQTIHMPPAMRQFAERMLRRNSGQTTKRATGTKSILVAG